MKSISNFDNHAMHVTEYKAKQPKALFVIVHGMAEHRHRYHDFATTLVAHDFQVYTLDLRGHGDSPCEGHYGYFGRKNGYLQNIDDISQFITEIKMKEKLPVVLFGHSMGSLFARGVLNHNPELIDSLIVSGVPWKPFGVSFLRYILRIPALFAPTKKAPLIDKTINAMYTKKIKDAETSVDWLSVDRTNIETYLNDELCGFPFTYRGYVDLMDLVHDVINRKWQATQPNLPILFLAGGDDPCPDFEHDGFNKAIMKMKNSGYKSISAIIYESSRHEILNDIEKETVTTDILDFLNKQNY